MYDKELVQNILKQILEAISKIEKRFESITKPSDFTDNQHGTDMLDSICMMLIAIGESLKKFDKITKNSLLVQYPEIDWKGVKGLRDIISHHYFDIDADQIFWICKNQLTPLKKAVTKIIKEEKGNNEVA